MLSEGDAQVKNQMNFLCDKAFSNTTLRYKCEIKLNRPPAEDFWDFALSDIIIGSVSMYSRAA